MTVEGLYETSIRSMFRQEISMMVKSFSVENQKKQLKSYLTMKEVSKKTGLGLSTIGDLMRRRALPHLRVKSKVLFLEEEIRPTIMHYKEFGWTDPDDEWDVAKAFKDVENLRNPKEEPTMIEEALRKIIRDELEVFVQDIKNATSKENYMGRTNLTIKEAAKYFRTSPSTITNLIHEEGMPHIRMGSRYIIVLEEAEDFLWRETAKRYADTGNIYWTRILERIDYEDKKRKAAFEKAMYNLENSFK